MRVIFSNFFYYLVYYLDYNMIRVNQNIKIIDEATI